jgi:hypothetical protein
LGYIAVFWDADRRTGMLRLFRKKINESGILQHYKRHRIGYSRKKMMSGEVTTSKML